MKSKLTAAVILLSASAGFAASGGDQTFTGVVSDSMCGKQHMMKGKSAAQCTSECVKAGSDYALVVGDKVYTLKGNKSELDKYAGEKATVRGSAKDDTITVGSVSAAK
jgi:type 1 fimbria pilin